VVVNGAEAVIDLAAYRRNLATVISKVAPARVMAVIKADAYGHGLLPLGLTAVESGVGWLGALDIATALELRANGIIDEVVVFAWLLAPGDRYLDAVDAGIDLGISSVEQLEEIAVAGASASARIHLKIDTGLHRNGATVEDWPALVSRAVELDRDGIVDLVGVWTHIAEASDEEDSAAIRRFHEAIAVAQALGAAFEVRHLAASAAGFSRADARFDLVRIGAFSYGIAPGDGITPASLGLIPVMTLSAPVLSVGSGAAVIGVGYGDGISSAVAGAVSVAVGGARYPVTAIELDRLVLDIGEASMMQGERAFLFGTGSNGEATLQEWADALGTIGEEIVTRLSSRVPRRYIG
jgi:alanine racemase